MTEALLTKKILVELRNRGAWAQKIHGAAYQTKGLPDIIACYRGLFLAFEVKLPGKERTLTALQAATLRDIDKAEGEAHMIISVEQATAVLDHVDLLFATAA